jgi:hypothetical protein
VLAVVLPNYLDDANSLEQAAVAKLLGLEPTDRDRRHDAWVDALREYTAASETNSLRACLAFSLVQGEDAVAGGWAYERGLRHREFLAAKGYEPTAYELEQAEATRARNEESRARTAEFRSRTEPSGPTPGAEEPAEGADADPDADNAATASEGDEARDEESDEALDDDAEFDEAQDHGGPTRAEGSPGTA